MRKIIHIDMDAFYASVEQRDFPNLKGKPVAVGREEARSVVCTASYEARKFGVHSAMPSLYAKRLCPDLIFSPPRFDVYKQISAQIREIFGEYTPLVEPLSLDEAYLDVTNDLKGISSATLVAMEIKRRIYDATKLTASAGVSYNKFLAKIASDYRKPNGIFIIEPSQGEEFIKNLPIEKFYGVGKVTTSRMYSLGIKVGEDLLKFSLADLNRIFGKSGLYYYNIARGIDNRDVNPARERKSYSVENTYSKDLKTSFERIAELYKLEQRLFALLDRDKTTAKTLTIKVRYADFSEQSKSRSFNPSPQGFKEWHEATSFLRNNFPWQEKGIRLLGLGVSGLHNISYSGDSKSTPNYNDTIIQPELFEDI